MTLKKFLKFLKFINSRWAPCAVLHMRFWSNFLLTYLLRSLTSSIVSKLSVGCQMTFLKIYLKCLYVLSLVQGQKIFFFFEYRFDMPKIGSITLAAICSIPYTFLKQFVTDILSNDFNKFSVEFYFSTRLLMKWLFLGISFSASDSLKLKKNFKTSQIHS